MSSDRYIHLKQLLGFEADEKLSDEIDLCIKQALRQSLYYAQAVEYCKKRLQLKIG